MPCYKAKIDWAKMLSPGSGRCVHDANAIAERLKLLDLDGADAALSGQALQEFVIAPNIDAIVESFCEMLTQIEAFNVAVEKHSDFERLQHTLKVYLLSLGVRFDKPAYFEERRRVGKAHQQIGISQVLYQCAFRRLQNLLIGFIPREVRRDEEAYDRLLKFVLKITALDMSLAVESYCDARVSGLKESLESERDETERLRKLSITDWLTDLHNHSYSRGCLSAALDRAKREGSPLCVIMADLDHFKQINDTHGHLIGDEVLRIAAARMVSGARAADRVARYGGEEFLFILQDTDLEGGVEVAERVRARLNSDAIHCGETSLNVTLSLGLAQARNSDAVDDLIERADSALYAAKAAGRDCVRVEQQYKPLLSA